MYDLEYQMDSIMIRDYHSAKEMQSFLDKYLELNFEKEILMNLA